MTLESYNDANLRTMRTASALGMAAGSIFLGGQSISFGYNSFE